MFFHRLTSSRKWRNTINLLVDDNDQETKEVDEREGKGNNYFQEIYNPPIVQVINNMKNDILRFFNLVVNNQMNEDMTGKVKEEEVRKIMLNMNHYKAPIPDGFPLAFSQELQDIVSTM